MHAPKSLTVLLSSSLHALAGSCPPLPLPCCCQLHDTAGAQLPVLLEPVAFRELPQPSVCVKLTPEHSEFVDGPQLGTHEAAGGGVGAHVPVVFVPVALREFPHPSVCVNETPEHCELVAAPQFGVHAGGVGAQLPVVFVPVRERVVPQLLVCVKFVPEHTVLVDGPQLVSEHGQVCVLQACEPDGPEPEQFEPATLAPPAFGFVQTPLMDCVPPPQLAEHEPKTLCHAHALVLQACVDGPGSAPASQLTLATAVLPLMS